MIGRRGLAIAIVAAFIVGSSVGLIGGVLFARSVFHPRRDRMIVRRMPGPEGGGQRPLPEMIRSLELTPEQEAQVREEVERSRGDFRTVRESLRVRIARRLTPEQRAEWERAQRSFVRRERGMPWPRTHPANPGPETEESR